jgi:hypothetical protein
MKSGSVPLFSGESTMNLKTKLVAILVLALLAMLTLSAVVAAAGMGWSG